MHPGYLMQPGYLMHPGYPMHPGHLMLPAGANGVARLLQVAAPWATPRALGLLLLREDPQSARIAADRRAALVDAALEDGARIADAVSKRWGREPDRIALRGGVSVSDCDTEQGWGATVVYAEYLERPARVRLFRPAIARLDRGLAEPGVRHITGIERARSALLAHELYHHFDAVRDGVPLARRHRVTLLRFGAWQWTSGLVSLAEIAAGAFAQRLLGLRWHPRFFDIITVHAADPQAAMRMVAALREDNAHDFAAAERGLAL